MHIVLHFAEGGGSQTLSHDLNFGSDRYEKPHTLTFRNPKPAFLRALQGGSAAGGAGAGVGSPSVAENGASGGGGSKKRPADGVGKKSKKQKRPVDIDRLADGLQSLGEDDLLQIVQMVNNQKTDDMYVRNDLDEGEFHIDLHTLSDALLLDMWKFTESATARAR